MEHAGDVGVDTNVTSVSTPHEVNDNNTVIVEGATSDDNDNTSSIAITERNPDSGSTMATSDTDVPDGRDQADVDGSRTTQGVMELPANPGEIVVTVIPPSDITLADNAITEGQDSEGYDEGDEDDETLEGEAGNHIDDAVTIPHHHDQPFARTTAMNAIHEIRVTTERSKPSWTRPARIYTTAEDSGQ